MCGGRTSKIHALPQVAPTSPSRADRVETLTRANALPDPRGDLVFRGARST